MKTRTLLLLTVLTLSCIQAKADLAPTVMLHRGGEVKTYMYYEVQKAVDDAVDGDTIYLSEGTFRPFNVNKRILVRGAGPTTLIEGSCIIDISGTQKLTMPVLDAITFSGDIEVRNAYRQFTLRKCRMANLNFSDSEFYDVKVDRCYFTNRLNLPCNVKEFNAFNSKIYVLYPRDYKNGKVTFEHCNIREICAPITAGVFNSTFIYTCTKLAGVDSNYNLINCILNSCAYTGYVKFSDCVQENCYSFSLGSSDTPIEFDGSRTGTGKVYTSALDGYVIGAYGGQHPFNRNPEIPGVTKHEISIDAATRTMTVKLTVDKLDK